MSKNYYETLGLNKGASKDEIKKAFRKLAHEHHPDKKGGNDAKFKEVSEAYSVLSDDAKRSQYDQFGSAGPNMGGGGGFDPGNMNWGGFDFNGFQNGQGMEFDLGDIFGDFFGGGGGRKKQKRGSDINVDVRLTFRESVFGTDKKVTINKTSSCTHCRGRGGEPGTEYATCGTCNGKGSVRDVKRTILGSISTTKTCENCDGKGTVPKQKCKTCHGSGVTRKTEDLEFRIPAGIEDGEVLRLSGAGEAVSGGSTGDLYIRVHVERHPVFRKKGRDLEMDLHIKLSEAILGATRKVSFLDGDVDLEIPAGIEFNQILRVKSRGVATEGSRERGSLLIHTKIDIPKKVSKDLKKVIEELKNLGS